MKNHTIRIIAALIMISSFYLPCIAQAPESTVTAYPVAAKDGAWCWFSDPRAVYYKGRHERIYYGYMNSKGDVVINSRDQKSKVVHTFTLHNQLEIDDHDVPSILFLPDGHILAFYTEHNGRFFMRKSKNPEDISSWEEERIIPFGGTHITYSHPVMLKGEKNRIYMFWRGSDWRPSFAYSDDLGNTWTPGRALISNKNSDNRPYLKVCSDNDHRIDFAFTDGHPNAEPTNSVYHVYYEKGKFYQTGGEIIASLDELPLQHSTIKKVYDATITNTKAWISDIALDRTKNPVIVYTRFPRDNDHRYHYARWNGKIWEDAELCKAGSWVTEVETGEKILEPYYSGGISLDHNDPSNVYMSRQINNVFEIEHWKKKGTIWQKTLLTYNSDISNMRPYVVAGYKGKKAIVLWMSGVYNHYTRFKTDLRIKDQ